MCAKKNIRTEKDILEPRGDFFEFSGTYAGGEEGKKTVQKNIILIILDTRLIWKSNLN